jgi:hypothetical protein
MRILISLVLIVAGFAILTAPNRLIPHGTDDALQKAAIGWIGALIGYWLA